MADEGNYVSQLAEYIRKNLKKGYTKESLKWALINQGHSKIEVEKALRHVDLELAKKAPLLETKPVITYEVVSDKPLAFKKPWWKKLFGS